MRPVDEDRIRTGQVLLGHRLRDLRQDRGLTLAELAERTGVAATYVSNVERALRLPSLQMLLLLADGLGVSVTELLADVYPFGRTERPAHVPKPPTDGRSARHRRPGA